MYTVQTSTQNRNVKLARGGQASIGLFGIAGTRPGLVAPPARIHGAVVQKTNPRLHRSRVKGALNSFDRDDATPTVLTPFGAKRPTLIPAMEAAARASDERERAQWAAEDAMADFLARNGGVDCVGITLSIED